MLLPLCAWAQVPIDHRATVPAVIPDSVLLEANIPYDQYKETVLDILQPKEQSKEKRPGVILIHGGGWVNGTKEQRVEYAALKYVARGFVVANVEYRLANVATAPAAVTDVLKAAQWFHKNAGKYHVDTNRIVVTGDPAGGHLALMVAMTPRSAKLGPPAKIAAVVNFMASPMSPISSRDRICKSTRSLGCRSRRAGESSPSAFHPSPTCERICRRSSLCTAMRTRQCPTSTART
jgi:Esterase/lipase